MKKWIKDNWPLWVGWLLLILLYVALVKIFT